MTSVRSAWLAVLLAGMAMAARGEAPSAPPAAADPVVEAIQEELARSMEELELPNVARPYFAGFWMREQREITVQATAGSLTRSLDYRARQGRLDLRVGSPELDNTGFHPRDRSLATSPVVALPIDPDPTAIRRVVWHLADRVYKSAAQTLESKRAFLAQKMGDLKAPDFALAPATSLHQHHEPLDIDVPAWEQRVRTLSALFRKHPSILESEVVFFTRDRREVYVSSEGTDVRHGSAGEGIEVNAVAMAPDGTEIQDFEVIYGSDLADRLPAFTRQVEAMADRLARRVKAPAGEDYLGPVLLEGQAACEFLGQLMAPALAGDRVFIYEDERFGSRAQGPALSGRINRRVMPEFLSVVDDPLARAVDGVPLLGGYAADQEGVVPQRVSLVEKGILKGLLMTRAPHERIRKSNGHARAENGFPGGRTSNLIVTSHAPESDKELRGRLMDLVKAQEMPYGLVIRKLNDELLESERGGGNGISSPLEAFRLYPDGREEEVRGLTWGGLGVRILRDILAAGEKRYVYNYYQSGRGGTVLTSVTSPALLLDEVELKAPDLSQDRPPVLPSPLSLEQGPPRGGAPDAEAP